jgi:hypothetical protein
MKIIQLSKDKVVLQITPIALLFVGIIFFIAGIIIFVVFTETGTLECNRTPANNSCLLTRSSLIKNERIPLELTTLERAEVKEYEDSEGGFTYKVVIITHNKERIDLNGIDSSGYTDKADIADQINNFIKNENLPSLYVQAENSVIGIIFSLAFSLAGLLMVLFTSKISVYIDNTTQKLSLIKKSILRKSIQHFSIAEIIEADVEEFSSSEGDTYRVILKRDSRDDIPLTAYYSSGYDSKKKIADTINHYLEEYSQAP